MMRSACAVGGVAVLLAAGASTAVAAPAVFSPAGPMLWKTTAANPMKLSWGAGPWQNRTCVTGGIGVPGGLPYGTGDASNTAGQGSLNNWKWWPGSLTCTDGFGASFLTTITASGPALANVNGGSYSLTSPRLEVLDYGYGPGLRPATTAVSFTAPYTNGTTGIDGANPSTWTFSNTVVGYITDTKYGLLTPTPLRLSGTLRTGNLAAPFTLS